MPSAFGPVPVCRGLCCPPELRRQGKLSRATIMEHEVLQLLPLPAGVETDSALLRLVFDHWWPGADAARPRDAGAGRLAGRFITQAIATRWPKEQTRQGDDCQGADDGRAGRQVCRQGSKQSETIAQ